VGCSGVRQTVWGGEIPVRVLGPCKVGRMKLCGINCEKEGGGGG